MKKLSTILKESTIKQVTGTLITFDENNQMVGKCAMGVISCEVGLILDYNRSWVGLPEILGRAGLDDTLIFDTYPYIHQVQPLTYEGEVEWEERNDNLGHIITHLNDTMKFTFKEIAEYLEVTFDL